MTKRKPKTPLNRKVEIVYPPVASLKMVTNRAIMARLFDALRRLGQIEGTQEAAVFAYEPRALRHRQLRSTLKPSASQASSTRRVLARLKRAGLIVGVGRRRGLKIYRTAADADRLMELSLGPFE